MLFPKRSSIPFCNTNVGKLLQSDSSLFKEVQVVNPGLRSLSLVSCFVRQTVSTTID